MIVSLAIEDKADLHANLSVKDPQVLDEAEKALSRAASQAMKGLPQPLGCLNYLVHMLFFDPHPPFVVRR